MRSDDALAALRESVRCNPANISYYRAALEGAADPIDYDDLADIVAATPAPATCALRPKNAISNLVDKGGLKQTITVDGQEYEGTYDDLMNDETIDPDAMVAYLVSITDPGRALLEEIEPKGRIEALFKDKPQYAEGFVAVLDLCAGAEAGVAKDDIRRMLAGSADLLRVDQRTGIPTLSTAFYTTNLEDAGALAWRDGAWCITDAGREALAKWK